MITRAKPLAWVLKRSVSVFNDVIRERQERGDAPADPAKIFAVDGQIFGLVEWADGRWLVLALKRGRGPAPIIGGA